MRYSSVNVNGKHFRTIWVNEKDNKTVSIIDQSKLPHKFIIKDLVSLDDACEAISEMYVRGAGLIGATAGYGMYLAAIEAQKEEEQNDLEKMKSSV